MKLFLSFFYFFLIHFLRFKKVDLFISRTISILLVCDPTANIPKTSSVTEAPTTNFVSIFFLAIIIINDFLFHASKIYVCFLLGEEKLINVYVQRGKNHICGKRATCQHGKKGNHDECSDLNNLKADPTPSFALTVVEDIKFRYKRWRKLGDHKLEVINSFRYLEDVLGVAV